MLLDRGAITITDALEVMSTISGTSIGTLRTAPGHAVDRAHLSYHRRLFPAGADSADGTARVTRSR